jgi:hypothetical protein
MFLFLAQGAEEKNWKKKQRRISTGQATMVAPRLSELDTNIYLASVFQKCTNLCPSLSVGVVGEWAVTNDME